MVNNNVAAPKYVLLVVIYSPNRSMNKSLPTCFGVDIPIVTIKEYEVVKVSECIECIDSEREIINFPLPNELAKEITSAFDMATEIFVTVTTSMNISTVTGFRTV